MAEVGGKALRFPLNRFLADLDWPLSLYAGLIIYHAVIAITVVILLSLSGPPSLLSRTGWLLVLPGSLSFVLTLAAFWLLWHWTRERVKEFRRYLPLQEEGDVGELLLKYKLHFLGGILGALIVVFFQVDALFVHPDPLTEAAYLSHYEAAFAASVLQVLGPINNWFFFGVLVSLLLGALNLFRICSNNARGSANLKPYDRDMMCGLSFLAGYAKRLLGLWVLPALPLLYSIAVMSHTWWAQSLLLLFVASTVAMVLFLATYFHLAVDSGRQQILEEIDRLSRRSGEQLTLDFGEESNPVEERGLLEGILVNARLQLLRDWQSSIETWPFGPKYPGSAILLSALPIVESTVGLFVL